MSPTVIWLLTLLAIAVFLYVAEIFVPSHGLLSILATGCLVVVVALCFVLNRWLGIGVMAALAVLGPIGFSVGVSVWQKTPVGRRMVLNATVGEAPKQFVLAGSIGTAVTEHRPMGECEFGDTRIESKSELGQIIPAGRQVIALAVTDGVATVRPVESNQQLS
ncbi:MAG: hypothetical protein QM754_13230 [Tepidisphaeraceae bacterium]